RTQFSPVVMVTALEADEDRRAAIDAGADDFVTKPFNSLVMLNRVQSLLRIKKLHDEIAACDRLQQQAQHSHPDDGNPQDSATVRQVTVLSGGIHGWTTVMAQHSANELLYGLSHLYSELEALIAAHHGILDTINGHEVVAFWDEQSTSGQNTVHALDVAVATQQVFHTLKDQATVNLTALDLSAGLHSGKAITGNVGPAHGLRYTVIGDPVYVACRLQQAARPGQILVSEAALQGAGTHLQAQRLGTHRLPGYHQPVTVYEVQTVLD
ncbi:MAG: hypothetical protein GYB65_10045, partial [Chloroflexi bacterium]|nr:hypothetical protein [Chloroflexota bacterium]